MTTVSIEGFRLSPQQEHLWLLQQEDGGPAYRAQCAISIAGKLDKNSLRSALDDVLHRHEILRTTFRYLPEMTLPLQVIGEGEIEWDQEDLTPLADDEQTARTDEIFRQLGQKAFDFENDKLVQVALLKLSAESHVLLLSMPSLCMDAVGLKNLVAEIARSYTEPQITADEPLQYADIAELLNEIIEAEESAPGREFWQQPDIFSAHMPALSFERATTTKQNFTPEVVSLPLEQERVRRLAESLGATVETLLLACWYALLWRYTKQEQMIVGVEFSLRKYGSVQEALGLFAKHLPLHCRVDGQRPFIELVHQLETAAQEAYKWQESFSWERFGEGTYPHHAPYAFAFSEQQDSYSAPPVSFSISREFVCHDRFKLKLCGVSRSNSLAIEVHYDSKLFAEDDAKRLAAQFRQLLASLLERPDSAIAELDILDDSARREVLFDFNQTRVEFSAPNLIHKLVEAQAERTPEAIAVVAGAERLSYRECNEKANRIAHLLIREGVGSGVPVGICVERSLEMIVGLLGILKAGGAYLPLDAALPQRRLEMMLADARPRLILTQQHLRESLPAAEDDLFYLDRDWSRVASESPTNPGQSVSEQDPAYIIYTSGSTGVPKGVVISHRAICNRLLWLQAEYPFTSKDRLLQKTIFSFDASIWEIFVPLLAGAQLVLAEVGEEKDASYLVRAVAEHEVTVLQVVPSMLALLVEEPGFEELNSLRRVFSGGEALPVAVASRFHTRLDAQLVNLYGPTESSIDATYFPCTRAALDQLTGRATVPIGKPLANVQVYVLDDRGQPVPPGVAGELHIGGIGLAYGYLNRPDLTAEKFVPNPFSLEPGARMYRTGDLTRYTPHGDVEFLGRLDQQVKIRGYRIEPGEIEAVLRQHPQVRSGLIAVREDEPGGQRLVAYVVPQPGAEENSFSVSTLRRYLKENLPEYMVPSAFVMLKALPRLPNGKVDLRALPAPEAARPELEQQYASPRTPVEEVLASIWSEILGVKRVGINDNFFDLGGHSLLVTQITLRVRQIFKVNLPLRSMFEAPTIAGFAERVEEAIRNGEDLKIPPITPVSRDRRLPLSFGQQRLWFLQQLDPESTAYNLPRAIRLNGSLNVAVLKRTLDEVVRRHESLRTTFAVVDGQPVQTIHQPGPVDMPLTDLSHMPEAERESTARILASEEALKLFDLSAGPLMRIGLLRLGPDEHVALLTMHHIVSDAWSFGVFIQEIATLYSTFLDEQDTPLTDLSIQYADYAVWQREWLSGDELESQLAFWKSQLSGELPIIQLPLDHPRPAVQTFNGGSLTTALPRELTGALKALSREEGVTLFMAGLAIFQTLLHRYSGQTDILAGSPIAGRQQAETEGLIGFFVNTLVFRTDLSGDPTFRELLKRVREVALGAYTHQDLPFEKLVEELQPGRDLSRSPLFQVMFAIQNAPAAPPDLSGISVSYLEAGGVTAKFDLSMTMMDTGSDLINTINYNTDLFDDATIKRLLDHCDNLMASIVREPDRRLSEFNLLAETEHQQIVVDWNQTLVNYPLARALHEFIEDQVARTPEATALVFEDEELNYGELNRRANLVAHHLQSLGVGPDVIVGVCMERSVELVVGLLGILKAGGAYLPLDPAYPSQRLQFMLADASPPVLLTQTHLLNTLPVHEAQVVCLDAPEWKTPRAQHAENPTIEVSGLNLAYVIYTSGSTGRPKGATNTHGAIVNRLLWMQDAYGLTPADRVLQKTPYSFDVSVWEFFWPLMTGARLVVASPGGHQDATYLAELIARQQITTVHFVPSMLQIFIDCPEARSCGSLRRVICSGEALSHELQERFHACLPAELHNLYGPTEAAVDVTAWACERGGQRYSVPIGRPIANTKIHILDRNLCPVPVGVAGELHIGGIGLARGYLNHPELTAERFISDPFSITPGARLYQTGDLARYWPNGEIEYLGRLDFQVKLRGLRIELEEIEAVLAEHEAVREAVVVAREDKPGGARLVAYCVNQDIPVTSDELRAHARRKLPDYMVPAAFVMLDELPLSPNGKLDRRALPEPEWSQPNVEEYIAPRTATEEIVAGIWMEVLGAKQVSVHDNFFEIGGHSLLATQVISRVREAFHVELLLRKVFEKPTLEGLAEIIDSMVQEKQGVSLAPPLRPVERAPGMPLSFAQQRLWFLNQLEPDNPFYNITMAVRIDGRLDLEALEKAFQAVVHRHETLRTTFSSSNGEAVQVIAADVKLEIPLVHLEQLPENQREDRVELLVLEETRFKFNLETGPLFRVTLLKLAEESHVAIIAFHHIVSDGWSLGLLIGDVASLYESHVKGEPSSLSDLPVQYADFAHWQRSWLDGAGLEMQLAYWRKQLAGAPPLLELPADYPRPVVPTHRGAHANLTVSDEVAEPLRLLGRAEGATLFMTLLAAFDILLARYTTQTDIVVGTPIANRTRVEVEKLIGFFTNTLVLRADLSGNLTFRELLRRIRDLALEAYTHQDLPFEQLVQELDPARELSHTPLFQVMFGVQNMSVPGVALPEMSITPMTVESGIAKFDLSLFMFDGGGDWQGRLEYSTDLFSSDTIARLIGHFQQLLSSIASNPDQRIEDLSMLLADERRTLLEEWNGTEVTDQHSLSIWQALQPRFETISPDAPAVLFYGEQLSYAELNERANRLANRLRRLGVGPDSLVAICMERSPEMIVALLAAIKADGAYVPLDASYPPERLAVMLGDARPLVLLTQEHLVANLPPHDSKLVLIDAEWESIAGESAEAPISHAAGDNLGYVIYTSGSTGKPKGIAMRQGALANLIIWNSRGATSAGPRTLQFASVSFDVSFQDIFSTLYWGGAVVLISQEDRLDSHALLRVITEQQVERMSLPVVALQQLAETAEELGIVPPSLHDVIAAGDRLQITKPITNWLSKLGCTMRNQYGPSENHVVMEHVLDADVSSWPSLPPIGRPIYNARIYVLDRRLNPVPVGVTGELYIGGESISRGYLNKPDLTAERFVPDLFGSEPGARLYKSGDLVRFLPDGKLEFVGRNDFQVKIRGFRVELGEIEAVLSEYPSVQGVVAVVNEDEHGQKRLLVYVVAEGKVESAELRSYLKERLPDYMVPSAIVLLDEFPLTSNGKINRQALPAPDPTRSDMEETYVAPRTPVEEVVAGFFGDVIGVERVGSTDNFFDLGGHSLLATLVMARIRQAFNVELPLRRIFEAPTVAGLAGIVEAERFAGDKPQVPAIVPVARGEEIPLTYLQERFWHSAQKRPPTFYHLETQLHGAIDVNILERVLNEIVRRQEILRTTFTESDSKLIQVVHEYEPWSLPFVDVSHLPYEEQRREVTRLSAEQTALPFDFAVGPPFRASLVRLSDEEHFLLVTLTHIIADRWSHKVLGNELTTFYDAYSQGLESPLPELPIQYADFAYWQRTWMQGEILRAQLDYWREHLAGAPLLLELPADFERPPVQTYNGANASMTVDEAVAGQLKKLSREAGVTLFMTTLTAYKMLLAHYSGQENIVVGTATSGRKQVVTEGLIGVFVNMILMHTELKGNPTFRQLLERVHEVVLGAYANEDTPFDTVVQELRPIQDPSYSPLAQVGFVLHSLSETAAPATLKMTPMQTYSTRGQYDLTLRIIETPFYVTANLEYNSDLFKADTINRILEDYLLLLEQIVANPELRLTDFQLLQISDRHHTAAS
ncbi:MAG TPA: amino acid adenylation domain-containing protein [Pyrinomonadaceae bacterium]|nr:amino acid adenylation domain-containing protein [Pyrinomonadaceae bacterium]